MACITHPTNPTPIPSQPTPSFYHLQYRKFDFMDWGGCGDKPPANAWTNSVKPPAPVH